jgi:enolase
MICGGSHAQGSVDIQEYLVIPVGLSTFQEALRAGDDIHRALVEILQAQGHNVVKGSGPVAPSLSSNREAVEVVAAAIEKAGYKLGEECFIGLDAATSELYRDGKYVFAREGRSFTSQEMADMWVEWADAYPIVSIEDGMAEEDWEGWQDLTKRIGSKVQLVGDDLFTTNPERVRKGIDLEAANAVLIKPNQIGTLTETLETISIAQQAGWATMMSTRSGETEDTTIADLAVLEGTGQIKTGPPCNKSVVKYNRLLRIAEELGDNADYAGFRAYKTRAFGHK